MNSNDRDRKKKWQLEKKLAARAAFSMPDALVGSLFDTVGARVVDSGCERTLRFTEQWIEEHRQSTCSVLGWLCDCEVLATAADHREHSR